MSVAVHIVNTPKVDTREAYEAAWERLRDQGLGHPVGRESHTAWMVGDVLHVLDVWDTQEHLDEAITALSKGGRGDRVRAASADVSKAPEAARASQWRRVK